MHTREWMFTLLFRMVRQAGKSAALIGPVESGSAPHGWALRYTGTDPAHEGVRESLCTLGNGYIATRGAAEEARADAVHYPGTYLGGGYDRLASEIAGQRVVTEDLVNWPNWLPLSFRPADGTWLSLDSMEVLHYVQELDLSCGILRRRLRVRDAEGRISAIQSERLVSMYDPHVAALRWQLTAENWHGAVEIKSGLDGDVNNSGVARYRALGREHLDIEPLDHAADMVWLVATARQSRVRLAQACRTRVTAGSPVRHHVELGAKDVCQRFAVEIRPQEPVVVEKTVVFHTSRDHAISEPLEDARRRLERQGSFATLLATHTRQWQWLWRRYEIDLGAEHQEENRVLRLHIFHLLQVASPHTAQIDVGVPARGLHGEAYRGHVFWDELFIFPLLNYSIPELTRELLMYRYRRLDAARQIAQDLGYEGACYPWQSGSNGQEESQRLHLNPLSGRWVADETYRQRHIGAAIAWNVWQYYQASGDYEFLSYYGAEMLLEIARFWASSAEWDETLRRFRIRGVVGPDEFHTCYPESSRPGIDDNAYTNVMAAWCLGCAEQALEVLSEHRRRELLARLAIDEAALERWRQVATKLRVVFHDGHIISQFDGYADLLELDWDSYRKRYGDVQRLDRILEAEGKNTNRYKASKQADVLMLFYLFSAEELKTLLASMGYELNAEGIADNVDYYMRRTSHGSTLSRVVHSWVLARSERARAWRLFEEALRSDVADVQGGTTAEGIHLGAMAGTVDLVKRGLTGAMVRDGVLWLDPLLPDELGQLCTRFRVQGGWLDVRITHDVLEVCLSAGRAFSVQIGVGGHVRLLGRGERCRVPLRA